MIDTYSKVSAADNRNGFVLSNSDCYWPIPNNIGSDFYLRHFKALNGLLDLFRFVPVCTGLIFHTLSERLRHSNLNLDFNQDYQTVAKQFTEIVYQKTFQGNN